MNRADENDGSEKWAVDAWRKFIEDSARHIIELMNAKTAAEESAAKSALQEYAE